ncbi:hypothetical protein D046_5425B, partial [Vibrio parahaemolyticus V-223/04]
ISPVIRHRLTPAAHVAEVSLVASTHLAKL